MSKCWAALIDAQHEQLKAEEVCLSMCACMYASTSINVCMQAEEVCLSMCACMCASTSILHTYMHTLIEAQHEQFKAQEVYVCMYVCKYVCTHEGQKAHFSSNLAASAKKNHKIKHKQTKNKYI